MDRKLTLEEASKLYKGICPLCESQLHKGPRGGLAMNVRCEKGHLFWVAPPFTPELLGSKVGGG